MAVHDSFYISTCGILQILFSNYYTFLSFLSRTSPVQLWRCAPIAQGVGFAMVILSLIVSIYYNVIMAYALIYVGASFVGTYDKLPWTYCGIGTISLIIRGNI